MYRSSTRGVPWLGQVEDAVIDEPKRATFGNGIFVGVILGVVGTLFFATIGTK